MPVYQAFLTDAPAVPGEPGMKIAVEVDGPHHFPVNGRRPLGEMLARQRLLNVRGWSVLSVPFFDWANKSEAAHIQLLQEVRLFAYAPVTACLA